MCSLKQFCLVLCHASWEESCLYCYKAVFQLKNVACMTLILNTVNVLKDWGTPFECKNCCVLESWEGEILLWWCETNHSFSRCSALYLSVSFSYENKEHNRKKKITIKIEEMYRFVHNVNAYSLVRLFCTCHSFKELREKIISEPHLDSRLVL